MPIKLEPAEPDSDYPGEDIAPIGAVAWGELLWKLYYWNADLLYDRGANSYTFRYDNFGHLLPAETCRGVADSIRTHLDEFTDPEERERWRAQIPYWQHCGGFFQRGKRQPLTPPPLD
jgi:hypothetical protein